MTNQEIERKLTEKYIGKYSSYSFVNLEVLPFLKKDKEHVLYAVEMKREADMEMFFAGHHTLLSIENTENTVIFRLAVSHKNLEFILSSF